MVKKLFALIIGLSMSFQIGYSENAKMLRYPNSSEKEITFCFAGDVYIVPIAGGLARKITTDDGIEMYPRFSPDGSNIAFSAQYDGNRELYLMPSKGGNPKRLTYSMDMGSLPERMGPDKIIMQWIDGGKNILYRTRAKSFNVTNGRLQKVNLNGSLPEEIPVMWSGYANFSLDGKSMAFNRIFREYRTWKRYRGGQADDIWVLDFATKELKNISNNPAQDIIPLWTGNKIYYLSDRDHTMNLFCYDISAGTTKKVTNFNDYDVKFPSLGTKHIAFENGGEIYLMDLATEKIQKIDIQIEEDFPWVRPTLKNVKDNITSYEVSHDAKRGLFTARGDVFTVPEEKGKIRNLTNTPNVHDKSATWSPDGKWIAFISDESGDDEIYLIKSDGTDKMKLTNYPKGKASYRYGLKWSPDSKKILTSDKLMNLEMIDIATKEVKLIAKSKVWEITDYSWSPDNKWISFSDQNENEVSVIFMHNITENKSYQVTSDWFNSFNPEFSKCGKYLFLISNRTFQGQSGNFEYNTTYNDMSTIFAITLQDTLPNPFVKFNSDEVSIKEESVEKEKDNTKTKDKKKETKEKEEYSIRIDLAGIKDRLFELPVVASNYFHLTHFNNKIYYVRMQNNQPPSLYSYSFEDEKENQVGDFSNYEISADGKKILFKSQGNYYIEKLSESVKPKTQLDLTGMEMWVEHSAEWEQIFDESWRQMKYFFYDPGMHGVDWDVIYSRYKPLVKYARHRDDLTYIIGEMIGELNVGHAYVGGGEAPTIKKIGIGLLGADLTWDGSGYKIENILEGRNWEEQTRSPFTELGINVKEGQYLIAIDGKEMNLDYHPYKALVGKVNEYVHLLVNDKPTKEGAKEVVIKTIGSESKLRYFNWVEKNRRYVDEKTGGKIGYVHIPDMGFDNGLNEFFKYYFPQANKEGMIIDDRYNGGGNVSPIVIERLRRAIAVVSVARNAEVVSKKPDGTICGPMVCLINQNSMSDGDLFPYQFKKMGLGKLIGKRSWGGVIGIRGSLPFIDGGYLNRPEFANFGADGTWILEGVGMEPDIEVDNHPMDEYLGNDVQLDRGIKEVIDELKNYKGNKVPKVPPFPDKSK